jgi:hypothetical protein
MASSSRLTPSIHLEDLLAELARVNRPTDGPGLRVEEMAEATGHSRVFIRRRVREGLRVGRFRRVVKYIEDVRGLLVPVVAYEPVPPLAPAGAPGKGARSPKKGARGPGGGRRR